MMFGLALGLPLLTAAATALLDGRRGWVGWLAALGVGGGLAALVALGTRIAASGAADIVTGGWPVGLAIRLRADALSITFAVTSVGLVWMVLLTEVVRGVGARFFPALVAILAAGLTGLFLTADAFNFYVFFEVCMITSAVLAAYPAARAERPALIFAVVNTLGSVLFLIAVGALYHAAGTLDIALIAEQARSIPVGTLTPAAALLLVAFGIKLGLYPFHYWLPPVYRATHPAVAAILAGAVANIGGYGLLRLGSGMLPQQVRAGGLVLLLLGAFSILYGGFRAVARRGARDVLAYSAIGQAGYVLLAVGLASPLAIAAAVVYSVANALNKTVLFLATGFRGWLVGAAFLIGALSVAGLPPSAGFFGKLALFRAATPAHASLVGLLLLGSALSFIYMLRSYQREFWEPGREQPAGSLPGRLLLGALAASVVVVGVWPQPLLRWAARAGEALSW